MNKEKNEKEGILVGSTLLCQYLWRTFRQVFLWYFPSLRHTWCHKRDAENPEMRSRDPNPLSQNKEVDHEDREFIRVPIPKLKKRNPLVWLLFRWLNHNATKIMYSYIRNEELVTKNRQEGARSFIMAEVACNLKYLFDISGI